MSSSTPLGCPTNPTVSLVTQPVGKHDAQEHIVLPPSENKSMHLRVAPASHIVLLEACRKAFQATFVALPPHRAQMFLMGLQMAFPTTAKSCAEGSFTLLPLSSTTPAVAFQTCSHPLDLLLAPLSPHIVQPCPHIVYHVCHPFAHVVSRMVQPSPHIACHTVQSCPRQIRAAIGEQDL